MVSVSTIGGFAVFLGAIALSGPAHAGVSSTTVTTFTYNADGAPTAISTQVDDGTPSTVYLTWDNFVPDAEDAASGTVRPANGNLAAVGSAPSSTTTSYSFDRRDRLVGYAAAVTDLSYAYHPDGTMASAASAAGDGLSFYYGSGGVPQIANMRQQSDGRWSARLGRVRHFDGGLDQILMAPRKDVSGEYESASESFTAYPQDAFGGCATSQTCADGSSDYDITDNPFRYAGEYRDAIWQGLYLRARWYDAQIPTFVSRDPLAHLNRYGYGDANPVMMTDPRGTKASFWKSLVHGFDAAVSWLDSGVQGHFSRLFLSPVLYPLEIVAHPGTFWQQLKRDPVQIAFIGASAVAAAAGGFAGASLAALEAQQAGIGTVQSIFSGFGDFRGSGHVHFDALAFVKGLESSVGAGLVHSGIGVGSRNPFQLSIDDVERLRGSLKDNEALIFRMRDTTKWRASWTSPLLETTKLGLYHDGLVAITKDDTHLTELVRDGSKAIIETFFERSGAGSLASGLDHFGERSPNVSFARVGKTSDLDLRAFFANPLRLEMNGVGRLLDQGTRGSPKASFNLLTNNCHHHAAMVIRMLRRRG